eukprot:TRINITY_DN2810_c1_g1_i2.p1 TRINITY_DN2810_c1_g1~~TRINITY_DN2810_c1_g1_i2.p1  ORF type:complete len:2003 (+),score=456.51 TRINITY_DN2810_c1_g1_i2:128-6136(+)
MKGAPRGKGKGDKGGIGRSLSGDFHRRPSSHAYREPHREQDKEAATGSRPWLDEHDADALEPVSSVRRSASANQAYPSDGPAEAHDDDADWYAAGDERKDHGYSQKRAPWRSTTSEEESRPVASDAPRERHQQPPPAQVSAAASGGMQPPPSRHAGWRGPVVGQAVQPALVADRRQLEDLPHKELVLRVKEKQKMGFANYWNDNCYHLHKGILNPDRLSEEVLIAFLRDPGPGQHTQSADVGPKSRPREKGGDGKGGYKDKDRGDSSLRDGARKGQGKGMSRAQSARRVPMRDSIDWEDEASEEDQLAMAAAGTELANLEWSDLIEGDIITKDERHQLVNLFKQLNDESLMLEEAIGFQLLKNLVHSLGDFQEVWEALKEMEENLEGIAEPHDYMANMIHRVNVAGPSRLSKTKERQKNRELGFLEGEEAVFLALDALAELKGLALPPRPKRKIQDVSTHQEAEPSPKQPMLADEEEEQAVEGMMMADERLASADATAQQRQDANEGDDKVQQQSDLAMRERAPGIQDDADDAEQPAKSPSDDEDPAPTATHLPWHRKRKKPEPTPESAGKPAPSTQAKPPQPPAPPLAGTRRATGSGNKPPPWQAGARRVGGGEEDAQDEWRGDEDWREPEDASAPAADTSSAATQRPPRNDSKAAQGVATARAAPPPWQQAASAAGAEAQRRADVAESRGAEEGVVKWITDKGYGFIHSESRASEVFYHRSQAPADLAVGDRVTFDTMYDRKFKGKEQAKNIRKVDDQQASQTESPGGLSGEPWRTSAAPGRPSGSRPAERIWEAEEQQAADKTPRDVPDVRRPQAAGFSELILDPFCTRYNLGQEARRRLSRLHEDVLSIVVRDYAPPRAATEHNGKVLAFANCVERRRVRNSADEVANDTPRDAAEEWRQQEASQTVSPDSRSGQPRQTAAPGRPSGSRPAAGSWEEEDQQVPNDDNSSSRGDAASGERRQQQQEAVDGKESIVDLLCAKYSLDEDARQKLSSLHEDVLARAVNEYNPRPGISNHNRVLIAFISHMEPNSGQAGASSKGVVDLNECCARFELNEDVRRKLSSLHEDDLACVLTEYKPVAGLNDNNITVTNFASMVEKKSGRSGHSVRNSADEAAPTAPPRPPPPPPPAKPQPGHLGGEKGSGKKAAAATTTSEASGASTSAFAARHPQQPPQHAQQPDEGEDDDDADDPFAVFDESEMQSVPSGRGTSSEARDSHSRPGAPLDRRSGEMMPEAGPEKRETPRTEPPLVVRAQAKPKPKARLPLPGLPRPNKVASLAAATPPTAPDAEGPESSSAGPAQPVRAAGSQEAAEAKAARVPPPPPPPAPRDFIRRTPTWESSPQSAAVAQQQTSTSVTRHLPNPDSLTDRSLPKAGQEQGSLPPRSVPGDDAAAAMASQVVDLLPPASLTPKPGPTEEQAARSRRPPAPDVAAAPSALEPMTPVAAVNTWAEPVPPAVVHQRLAVAAAQRHAQTEPTAFPPISPAVHAWAQPMPPVSVLPPQLTPATVVAAMQPGVAPPAAAAAADVGTATLTAEAFFSQFTPATVVATTQPAVAPCAPADAGSQSLTAQALLAQPPPATLAAATQPAVAQPASAVITQPSTTKKPLPWKAPPPPKPPAAATGTGTLQLAPAAYPCADAELLAAAQYGGQQQQQQQQQPPSTYGQPQLSSHPLPATHGSAYGWSGQHTLSTIPPFAQVQPQPAQPGFPGWPSSEPQQPAGTSAVAAAAAQYGAGADLPVPTAAQLGAQAVQQLAVSGALLAGGSSYESQYYGSGWSTAVSTPALMSAKTPPMMAQPPAASTYMPLAMQPASSAQMQGASQAEEWNVMKSLSAAPPASDERADVIRNLKQMVSSNTQREVLLTEMTRQADPLVSAIAGIAQQQHETERHTSVLPPASATDVLQSAGETSPASGHEQVFLDGLMARVQKLKASPALGGQGSSSGSTKTRTPLPQPPLPGKVQRPPAPPPPPSITSPRRERSRSRKRSQPGPPQQPVTTVDPDDL